MSKLKRQYRKNYIPSRNLKIPFIIYETNEKTNVSSIPLPPSQVSNREVHS